MSVKRVVATYSCDECGVEVEEDRTGSLDTIEEERPVGWVLMFLDDVPGIHGVDWGRLGHACRSCFEKGKKDATCEESGA